jgi:hypothetical protein
MLGLFKLHHRQEAIMLSISQALKRIKTNLADTLPESTIHNILDQLGISYRQRTLTPVLTTYLFLRQILHGNTAVSHLRHLAGLDFTDSAYCQARQRLPVSFFYRLHQAVLAPCRRDADRLHASRWHGHRLFGIDGSSFSMPDTEELQEEFGQPSGQREGCGFPTAHLLVQFDLEHGFLLRALPAPWRTHDLKRAAVMHHDLSPGDLLLGDRAFCSYAHLALCRERRLQGLFRAHQRQIISFRPHRRHAGPGKISSEDIKQRGRQAKGTGTNAIKLRGSGGEKVTKSLWFPALFDPSGA